MSKKFNREQNWAANIGYIFRRHPLVMIALGVLLIGAVATVSPTIVAVVPGAIATAVATGLLLACATIASTIFSAAHAVMIKCAEDREKENEKVEKATEEIEGNECKRQGNKVVSITENVDKSLKHDTKNDDTLTSPITLNGKPKNPDGEINDALSAPATHTASFQKEGETIPAAAIA